MLGTKLLKTAFLKAAAKPPLTMLWAPAPGSAGWGDGVVEATGLLTGAGLT